MGLFNFWKSKNGDGIEALPENLNRENKNKLFAWQVLPINTYMVDELLAWYSSNSNILLEFYSANIIKEYPRQFIFYRNCENYFWAQSAKEKKIKRTTAGLMYSIVKIIDDIVGIPKISIFGDGNGKLNERLKYIEKQNSFLTNLYYGKQLPLTGVIGWGAYRIDIDNVNEKCPRIRYYDGRNCSFEEDNQGISKIKYADYFIYKNKQYVIIDERYVQNNVSCIDKKVYEITSTNDRIERKLNEFPNLKDQQEHIEVNVPFILGVPCRWYETPDIGFSAGLFGRSLFYGKIDSLDDFDQAVSIAATSIRRSTPKVSYPVDSLETDKNGNSKTPDRFDLEYIEVPSHITGDGKTIESQGPHVVQPNIVIDLFIKEQNQILNHICNGIISIADVGISKEASLFGDTGTALREKSKQTLFTRNLICRKEQEIIKTLFNRILVVDSIFFNGGEYKDNYDIEVLYDKFSIPSKEERVKVYLPMFQSGAISDEMFVSLIYDDDLSQEDKEKEISAIKTKREMQIGETEPSNKIVPEVPRSTSPYEAEDRLDNQSGMNNYNRGVKGAKEI